MPFAWVRAFNYGYNNRLMLSERKSVTHFKDLKTPRKETAKKASNIFLKKQSGFVLGRSSALITAILE